MKKVKMSLHNFIPTTTLSPNDRKEIWWKSYRCKNCGLRGRRYSINEPYIYVTDSFSDKRINRCERDNFVDKYLNTQIQISCIIKALPEIPIYSVHTVITPPIKFLNGENGVWIGVKGRKEPVQILFEEYVDYPLKRHRPFVIQNKKSDKPKVIPPYMHIKHVRTTKPKVKFTRTIKPIKRTRTR